MLFKTLQTLILKKDLAYSWNTEKQFLYETGKLLLISVPIQINQPSNPKIVAKDIFTPDRKSTEPVTKLPFQGKLRRQKHQLCFPPAAKQLEQNRRNKASLMRKISKITQAHHTTRLRNSPPGTFIYVRKQRWHANELWAYDWNNIFPPNSSELSKRGGKCSQNYVVGSRSQDCSFTTPTPSEQRHP